MSPTYNADQVVQKEGWYYKTDNEIILKVKYYPILIGSVIKYNNTYLETYGRVYKKK